MNYIKIIYFIDKIKNETYSELYHKTGYFFYLMDILSETKEGSLYSLLTRNSTFNIKSIVADCELILKSRIKFYIEIQLNCLKNINDIIFITYQYMNKIIQEGIGDNMQIDRYMELKNLANQTLRYTEKTFDTIELAKNNGINLFDTKYRQDLYFYPFWVPWEKNMTNDENIKNIKNESWYYFKQLKPNNSVIVIGLKGEDIKDITCNENSFFPLNCTYLKNINNTRETHYLNINYTKMPFNSSDFENKFDIENNANISFIKNNFISKHNKIIQKQNEIEQNTISLSQNILNTFYFKRNVEIRIPKVFISINLLHPYLRPLLANETMNDCFYFQILEFFSAIKRKANEMLADAIRAGNEITFHYNENFLYINIICYEDVAYEIVKIIKNIIFEIDWEDTDFINNNEIYKYETNENFFNYGDHTYGELGKYYFFCKVKNGLFNKYEFNIQFNYEDYCLNEIKNNINNLNKLIVNGLIYGYCNISEAEKISGLFDRENEEEEKYEIENLLRDVNNYVKLEDFVFWVNEIKELNESDNNSVNISEKIIKKSEGLNIGYRYISLSNERSFSSNYMQLSLLENMFGHINTNTSYYLVDFEMFTYRDIYFCFYLNDPTSLDSNPNNDTFVDAIFKTLLEEAEEQYSQKVDNIGDKFYYLQKNLELILFKKQSSLSSKATEELNYRVYNNSILLPEKIIKEYNNKKKGKNFKFNDIKKLFRDIVNHKKFDVNTVK